MIILHAFLALVLPEGTTALPSYMPKAQSAVVGLHDAAMLVLASMGLLETPDAPLEFDVVHEGHTPAVVATPVLREGLRLEDEEAVDERGQCLGCQLQLGAGALHVVMCLHAG
jgi:hypothetical protein